MSALARIVRWVVAIALTAVVTTALAGEDTPDDREAIASAVARAQAEMDAMQSALAQLDPVLNPVLPPTMGQAVTEAADRAQALVVADPVQAVDVAALRAQIEVLTEAQLGADAVQEALAARMGPRGAGDPNGAMTYQAGKQGLLWLFWATDAPGTEVLPGQIAQTVTTYPDLVVRDLHVARLSDWHAMLKYLSQVKDYLEKRDPSIPVEEEAARKRDYIDQNLKKYRALTTMATTRRTGGYLIIEDMSPGIAWRIAEVPSLIFLSPRGLVHRVRGLNEQRPIAAWIASCLDWEERNRSTLEARGVRW